MELDCSFRWSTVHSESQPRRIHLSGLHRRAARNSGEIPGFQAEFYTSYPVQAGITYHIRGYERNGFENVSYFQIQALPTLANDNFDNESLLSGPDISLIVSLGACTAELNESIRPNARTAWYRWIAPVEGRLILSAGSTNGFGQVALFGGSQLSSLVPLASADFIAQTLVSSGDVIHIQLSESENALSSTRMDLRFIGRPPNDNFQRATDLIEDHALIAGNNEQATVEPGEIMPGGQSVWYRWTAPTNGLLDLTANMRIDAYTGNSITSLVAAIEGLFGEGRGPVRAGEVYYLRLSRGQFDPTDYQINLNFYPKPANDNFETPLRLDNSSRILPFSGTTWSASMQSGEPLPQGFPPDIKTFLSVWWIWTAAESGRANISMSDASFVSVFTGSKLDNLQFVSTWDTNDEPWARTHFLATAGSTYYIRLATGLQPQVVALVLEQPGKPMIKSLSRQGSSIQFQADLMPNTKIILETSTNLSTWTSRLTNTVTSIPWQLQLPVGTQQREFFRLRSP